MKRALLLVSLLVSTSAQAVVNREWDFQVFLENREIGTHTFRVSEFSGERRVESDAQFTVSILFFDAYSYRHRAREHWNGECLAALDAATDDNGEPFLIRGARSEAGFRLDSQRTQVELPACVMSFAYWNPRMLEQTRLLNVQTGELLDVRVEAMGEETISVRDMPVPAQRYALHTPNFRIDIWYLTNQEWVRLESFTAGGKRLRYEMR